MATVELESLLDEKDVSRLLKRSLASIRRDRLMRKGVPYVRIGGCVRYTPQALREFLNACAVSVETEVA